MSLATPVPGGGSASAASGAIGVSLLIMAAKYSLKSKYCRLNKEDINDILKKLLLHKKELEALIDKDIKAYLKVRACLKFPKDSRRRKMLEHAFKGASIPPLRVCEISHDALRKAYALLRKGSKHLASDVRCGGILQLSAFSLGWINADSNLKYIQDKKFVRLVRAKLKTMRKNLNRLVGKF